MGFSMPAEWEPHEATWLAWPHNPTDWPDKLDTICWVYGEIVRKISPGERIRMLVNSAAGEKTARRYLSAQELTRRASSSSGTQPIAAGCGTAGPYLSGATGTEGRRPPSSISISMPGPSIPTGRKIARCLKLRPDTSRKRLFDAQIGNREFVLEGGGIEVNGRGTLLTTEECYLHPEIQVRNPGLDRKGFEKALHDYLGATNVFWLAGGVTGDDTHGHIDDICRFVDRKTLVLIKEENTKDVNYGPLNENWERIQDLRLEDGSKPEVIALPMPDPIFFDGDRLPASYANFYIANHAVLVPTFNDPKDRLALGLLGELFKDRIVVGVHAVDLVLGFGTLHCLTQQQPA